MYIYIYIHKPAQKKMDEEMENFIEDFLEPADIDWNYEFDGPHFFDFSPIETESEVHEAERWFEFAESYPPSPLIANLKMGNGVLEKADGDSRTENGGRVNSISRKATIDACSDVSDVKVTRSSKSRISTLMKPTVSHLAKLRAKDAHSSCVYGRADNTSVQENGNSFQSSPRHDNGASKRQKLEIGFLRKVAHLTHQNSLLHKFSKKVTIPKEPDLETQQRAHTRRSRISCYSSEHAEPRTHIFKARPLNTKILQAPSLLPPRRTRPELPEFQVFHLKTMERAMQHSSAFDRSTDGTEFISENGTADLSRPKSSKALKEKGQTPTKTKMCSPYSKIFQSKEDIGRVNNIRQEVTTSKESKFPKDEKLSPQPPTELFEKLSLRSELESGEVSQRKANGFTKVSKENTPDPLQPELWESGAAGKTLI